MKIFWQGFVEEAGNKDYYERLRGYLNGIAAAGTEVVVEGLSPSPRDFGRLSEFRSASQAIRRAIMIEEGEFDAYVMGHFQDPGMYEIRTILDIPVIGTGEATLHAASTLGRRMGLVTLSHEFEVYHWEQAERYGLADRLVKVTSIESTPEEFNIACSGDEKMRKDLYARIEAASEALVEASADVIVTAGMLAGLFVADYPGLRFGHAPVVNCALVTLKHAEMWAQLKSLGDLGPSRGPSFLTPGGTAQQDFLNLFPEQSGAGKK